MVKVENVLLHPYVTEKTMNLMTGTPTQDFKDGNKLEFIVKRSASKADIKLAFEKQFDVKVEKVWVRIDKEGKHAIVRLKEGYSAEDIGMRIGVF
jgi:large subunit ribosomal protein L23